MSIRGPFVRSASVGGGASVPLLTGTPPAPTGLSSPPTSTSSSNYSSDGTQSTNQHNAQSSTSPSSSPTTSGQTSSASVDMPFPSSSLSDGTLTNYKGLEPSTDTLTSISSSSHSSMSTGGGALTNGPPSGGTTLPPPVSTGGTTPQNSPTTFGPPNSGPATSVSPSSIFTLLPSTIPTLLPSSILTLPPLTTSTSPPSSILTLPPSTIPTSPPSSILTSLPSSIPTSLPPPPTQKPSAPSTTSQSSTLPGQETSSKASSSTTSPIVGNPTTTSSTPSSSADKPSTTSSTPSSSADKPSTTSSTPSSSADKPSTTSSTPSSSADKPSTTSSTPSSSADKPSTTSTPSSSADKPSTTSDTNLSTPLPNTQTFSQQSTSPTTFTTSHTTTPGQHPSIQKSTLPTTSTTSDTTTPGQRTSSQHPTLLTTSTTPDTTTPGQRTSSQHSTLLTTSTTPDTTTPGPRTSSQHSTSPLTSPTSSNPQNASPTSSTTSSTSSSIHGPATSPETVSGAQSSHTPQSPSGSAVNTPIPTGNGLTFSSADSPTPSGGPVGNPSSTYLSSPLTGVAENVMSTTSPIPPSGDTFSSITYTSIGTSTIIAYSSFGSTSVLVTLTSTSTSVIRTTTPVPTSGARSNEAPIIGGIVGGVLALLLLGIAACYLIGRRRRPRAHQQLYDSDLTATLSAAEAATMRENHPYSPTYSSVVGGQGASESRGALHHAANSFGPSAFPHPSFAGSSHNFSGSLSGSALHEDFDRESDGGGIGWDNESEGTERDFASAQSFYASNDGESSLSGGIGIAIGSQSSIDLHSYHTAATTLVAGAHAIVDNDDSPGPSPSAFPVPPVNPFLDGVRVVDLSDFMASRAPQSRQVVSALTEDAALPPVKIRRFSEQQASWAAAVAAASPVDHDAPTPIATRSLNALIGDVNDDDPSSKDLQTPTQSHPPVTPVNDSYFIINPLLRETSQEEFNDDSGDSSHETVSIMYPYPFESTDKGKEKEYLSADLGDDPKNNRLSNASSGLVFPEDPSQCGLAL